MRDEQPAKREHRYRDDASFAPRGADLAVGRGIEHTQTAGALNVGKHTLVEEWSAQGGTASPRLADPIAAASATVRATRQIEALRSANAAADHYASCEAAFQLKLALESARACAGDEPHADLAHLEATAASLLAEAFTPSREAVTEAGPAGSGGRDAWNRDVATWRAARAQTWMSQATKIAAQLGIEAVIRVDDAPAAHGARGLAHAGIVHLVPALAPEAADAQHVLAHELVHVAQSQLPVAGSIADAEQEADTLAAALVNGGLPHRPRVGIASSIAAADNGARAAERRSSAPAGLGPPNTALQSAPDTSAITRLHDALLRATGDASTLTHSLLPSYVAARDALDSAAVRELGGRALAVFLRMQHAKEDFDALHTPAAAVSRSGSTVADDVRNAGMYLDAGAQAPELQRATADAGKSLLNAFVPQQFQGKSVVGTGPGVDLHVAAEHVSTQAAAELDRTVAMLDLVHHAKALLASPGPIDQHALGVVRTRVMKWGAESARISRRLQTLRGWSYGTTEQVPTGDARAGRAARVRTAG